MRFINVIEKKESRIGHFIAQNIAKQKDGVLFVSEIGMQCFGKAQDEIQSVVVSSEQIFEKNGIKWDLIVILDSDDIKDFEQCFEGATIIASEENMPMNLSYAKSVISCGYSEKSTITLSGRTEYGCMISLQREVVALDGNIVEPQEFTVSLGDLTIDGIMLVVAALICIGVKVDI